MTIANAVEEPLDFDQVVAVADDIFNVAEHNPFDIYMSALVWVVGNALKHSTDDAQELREALQWFIDSVTEVVYLPNEGSVN